MQSPITGFHLDDEHHWVAELRCGHFQHVRHDPPWTLRPWVVTEPGRLDAGANARLQKVRRGRAARSPVKLERLGRIHGVDLS